MKRADKSAETIRNFGHLISKLSENEILTELGMSNVRGGDGEGAGGSPVIIIPKPPQ
jgi:hypothetical protein